MNPDRWEQLQELFHRALPLDAAARTALLHNECRDPSLRAAVERLLDAHGRASDFMESPAAADAARLESAIGRRVGAFRLVQELGRGGMGAVYLAERDDGAFQQRVAIKLIKRGMDTEQVLARFRIERQILASLDHPNIARLVDGGTTEVGLPYFAMEYIEGQPIDTYATERSLSVEDRLRLFLQVCDAISFAHSRGVIHRDIKPLNTLVTPSGVPKLLDFGIAKVLHDGREDATATLTGLRLLTPDYASPEQVEGRPATAASDVYSLGVMLYELLTGSSPYRLESRAPQDIAAAVCSTDPERPSTIVTQDVDGTTRRRRASAPTESGSAGGDATRRLSRRLRGDLDTIVLTALRKEPHRRYASVDRLASDIRRHLDGRPVLARGDQVTYRARKFARRYRAGLLAVGGAVAMTLAAVLVLQSTAGTPTLLDGGTLHLRDRILVADFVDRTGDTALTSAVTETFQIDLGQSPVVQVLTPRQVRTTLERMQRPVDVVLDDSLAREVALREGVKAIVSGSLARVSGAFTVSVQLIAAQDGRALSAIRETARDSTQLIAAVERASKALRRSIGESLRDIDETPPLDYVTTASLPALRLYTEGQRLVRQGQRQAAIERFEAAVGIDTGFAAAFVSLGMAYGSTGNVGKAFATRAPVYANLERLTFHERSIFVAATAYGNRDWETAIRVYHELLDRYPDDYRTLNNLGLAYRDARQPVKAESLFRRASEVDSTIANFYSGMHESQLLQRDTARARVTLETLQRRFPDHPLTRTAELQNAAAAWDWRRLERTAQTHIERAGRDTARLVEPYEALASSAMARGRLREAEELWRRQLEYSRASASMGTHTFGALQLAYLYLRYRRDTARAVAFVDSALRAIQLDSLLHGNRLYYDAARFYIAAGKRDRVAPLLSSATVTDSVLGRKSVADRAWTRAMLSRSEDQVPGAALDQLRQAAETHECHICVYPELGRAYEAAGQLENAARAYAHYLTAPWLFRYAPDAVELGWTMLDQANVTLKLGNRELAARTLALLDELWRDADPGLRREVEALRARLAGQTDAVRR